MAEVHSLSTTDASNTARFPENQAPSTVNNGARALEGMLARFDRDNDGSLTTAGTSTAYTVTLNSQHSAWFTGLRFRAKLDQTCGATPTINPTGSAALGAKSLYTTAGAAVASGALIGGGVYDFVYDGTNVQVVNSKGGETSGAASSTDNAIVRFNGTDGKTLQNSAATLDDNGAIVSAGSAASADLQRSAAAPYLYLTRTDTHGDLASISLIGFYGKDDGGTAKRYNFINVTAVQDAAGSETGRVEIGGRSSGTDATRFIVQTGLQIGSPTGGDQGVGTTNAVAYYIDGRLVYPAGCWGYVTVSGGTPTLQDSHNVTSITDTATGRLRVTIATDFANANYAVEQHNNTYNFYPIYASKAVGSIILENRGAAGGLDDPNSYDWAFYGDI
ncbi:MAG: hypothetical protein KIT32_12275 [Rhodocyclaceae bacterium]|nr:hypothetical protein [Rhodocyclaceae bacterium]